MTLVQIPVDEKLLASAGLDPVHAGEEFRILAAAKLFELRRISLGQGAELAGLPLGSFMEELGKLKISWINLTDEQVVHDLEMA